MVHNIQVPDVKLLYRNELSDCCLRKYSLVVAFLMIWLIWVDQERDESRCTPFEFGSLWWVYKSSCFCRI